MTKRRRNPCPALRMAHLLACVIEHEANRIDSDGLVGRHGAVRITFAEELELLRHASGFTINPRLSRRQLFQVFGNNLSRDTVHRDLGLVHFLTCFVYSKVLYPYVLMRQVLFYFR